MGKIIFVYHRRINQYVPKWLKISKQPIDRYIAGMSMGGYGAYYAALKNRRFITVHFLTQVY